MQIIKATAIFFRQALGDLCRLISSPFDPNLFMGILLFNPAYKLPHFRFRLQFVNGVKMLG